MTWLDDVQRRLVLAGARGVGQQIADQIGRAFHGPDTDVWATATTEDPAAAQAPPECAWCPVCRALRAARDAAHGGGPDLASRVSGTADTVISAAVDMVAVIESALTRPARRDDEGWPPGPGDAAGPDGGPARPASGRPG